MELVLVDNNQIIIAEDVVEKIKAFNKAKLEMDLMEKELKESLKNAMEKVGIKKFIINGLSATIKDPYIRKSLDTKRLETECPDIYRAYLKETEVASSITLSIGE